MLLGLFLGPIRPLPGSAGSPIQILTDKALPETLERARDLRWADDDGVHLGAGPNGTHYLSLTTWQTRVEIDRGHRGGAGIWLSSRLARSGDRLVVAAAGFEIAWKDLRSGSTGKTGGFEFIEDVDLWSDRLVLLGTRHIGPHRTLSPDGAVAWVGTLARRLEDAKALLVTPSGKGPVRMDACGNFELGAVRFLPDGSLVVVPGAEPGAYLFDTAGRLVQTWDTQALGLEALCDFDQPTVLLFARDPEPRWAWINRFRIVDEILPLREGIGLIVRIVGSQGTRWEMQVLRRAGSAIRYDIPIATASTMSHLRADIRNDRIAFLVLEEGRLEKPQQARPRLFVTSLPR